MTRLGTVRSGARTSLTIGCECPAGVRSRLGDGVGRGCGYREDGQRCRGNPGSANDNKHGSTANSESVDFLDIPGKWSPVFPGFPVWQFTLCQIHRTR